jgi:hypothetical protein
MHHHFSRNLKVKGLIESSSPSLVVELGTGGGENTEQLAVMKRETRPYADAINDTIGDWEVVAKTKASCGAIALQK